MFVSRKERIFDVERHADRCVCGCSAIATSSSGYDRGYCDNCSKERDNFVNEIVGNIDSSTNKKEIELELILEQIRKSIIQERIYYLIDKWFVDENNNSIGNHNKPYEDVLFVANCIKEKDEAINTLFRNSVDDSTLPNVEYQSPLQKTNYYKKILNMYEKDLARYNQLRTNYTHCKTLTKVRNNY